MASDHGGLERVMANDEREGSGTSWRRSGDKTFIDEFMVLKNDPDFEEHVYF